MVVSSQFGYAFGCLLILSFWIILFLYRKDLRQEMLTMGFLIGVVSVFTAYYWWTVDWWHPQTLTSTRIGLEDFISGFASGGVMAVIYEVIFKKRYYKRKLTHHQPGGMTILLIMIAITSWLFWIVGITSFWSSTFSLVVTSSLFYFFRRDLFINGLLSGALMVFVSMIIYYAIIFISPNWINLTYDFNHLSGILVTGIPIEELTFWFLAGFLFGPFYEYWKGEKLRIRKL